ncbi:MAG: tail fiber domain-containing protein [Bacteroidota bacterium]
MRLYIFCIYLGLILSVQGFSQTGIGTIAPNSTLDVRGGMAVALRSFTSGTTASANDYALIFTGTAAALVTLPDAGACAGRVYWIKNASITLPAPVLTLTTVSAQTVNGLATWDLDESNEAVRILSNGTNWLTSSQDAPTRKTATLGSGWNEGGNRVTANKTLGTTSNNNFLFTANNQERMRLTTSGYLGIGTANPSGRLHLANDNDNAGNKYYFDDYGTTVSPAIYLRKIRGSVAAPQNLQSGDLIGQLRFAAHYNGAVINSSGTGIDAHYQGTGTNNSTDMHFFTSNTERMVINEFGNIGIGSSAFSATPEKLLIDAGTTSSYNLISAKGELDNYLQLNIQNRSTGTTASSDVVATADNGDENSEYIDMGINSSGYSNSLIPIVNGASEAYLFSTASNFVIGNGTPSYDLSLFTGGYATTNERLRITAGGNIAIGAFTPADKLSVAGIMSPTLNATYSIGTSIARWTEVWSANGTIQTSDIRLKKNIRPLRYSTAALMQLQPVSYNWKDKQEAPGKIGLIAQEVKKIIPEVVAGDEQKEMLGINYPELIPVLIATIKEQQQKLSLLNIELDKLENRIK